MDNKSMFETACSHLVGGVNSPVRAWKAVGGTPRFYVRGKGPRVYDVEGREYLDYVCSWGPLILGHSHPSVVEAVQRAAEMSTSFGAPCVQEVMLAMAVKSVFPSMEKVRFVSSGTEATMSALRLARGFTGRDKIVKFDGCYHGHSDSLLVAAGSGALTFGVPNSPGITEGTAKDTLVLPFNDLERAKELFSSQGDSIAAVIVEPWAGNMGLVPPAPGFLQGLRDITESHGALLIFDEVITGFRNRKGGAQQVAQVTPDLTCLGKVIGGGLPVGAFGGPGRIMDRLSPIGDVYQAGTLSGNPLAMAAGLATLEELSKESTYDALESNGLALQRGLQRAADEAGVPLSTVVMGGLVGMFFSPSHPTNLEEVKASRADLYGRFFQAMMDRGYAFAPSAYETVMVSSSHSERDIESTVEAAKEVFDQMAKGGLDLE
ncbi:glutamate-1-semialdehyde 2,1-aminomutase [Dethiosulfovibrio salsuginis]|uniref:Glutamate-1-semialdehyde 2,1-aminomutase n=1 Tax=Dethiosulfovibrio salsuginis TaxID=561720 RepID=A0A1X7KCX6_9BACT|nr:glutamate-1-semialdehyde 2,1-aminomutase [Dethiosulfovibrio salsuginis]SMG39072.1 glutamate-1-semialdehyde 2,1-aminomutase [Dethiosulfovibrio salsuginis]